MKLTIQPDYAKHEKAIIALISDFLVSGNLIVQGSRNSIKSNFLESQKVSIKFFQKPGFFKAIIYSYFRSTKAKRSFEYANYLLDHKISTPSPIAFVEFRNSFGFLGDSYYICQHIDYDFTIRELIHNPLFKDRTKILEQFTKFTFEMHQAKINFLDHSPGNTLIINSGNSLYDFYLIDLNRMKFQEMNLQQRMDNFKKMWLSRQMIRIISKKYADLSKQSEDKLYTILLQKTRNFKRKITKKKYLKRKIGK